MDVTGITGGLPPAALLAFFGLGSATGVLAAFFGVGGGLIVGPALLLAGLPGTTVIGSSTVFLFATSLLAIPRYRLAPEDLRLGLLLGLLLPLGIEPGRRLLLALEELGHADRLLMGGFLLLLGWMALRNLRRPRPRAPDARPPVLPRTLAIGFLAGVLAGLFGIGGGIVLVPLLTRGFHRPPKRAVPISLLAICVGGLYAAASYAWSGRVAWIPAAALIAGSALGVPGGAWALRRVPDGAFRPRFAALLLLTAAAIVLRLLGADAAAPFVLVGAALALAAWILAHAARAKPAAEPS